MKQYHVSNGDSYDAETKLKHAQDQKTKVESQANKASKKLKTLEKQVEKVSETRGSKKRDLERHVSVLVKVSEFVTF